jgi:hypothetical protein
MTLDSNIPDQSATAESSQSPEQSESNWFYAFKSYVPGKEAESSFMWNSHAALIEERKEYRASKPKKPVKLPNIKAANPDGAMGWELQSDQYRKENNLGKPPVVVVRTDFLEELGDWNQAALLTQIVYWYTAVKNAHGNPLYAKVSVQDAGRTARWIAKTAEEWAAEIHIPASSVYKALKELRELGLISQFNAEFGSKDPDADGTRARKKRMHVSLEAAEGHTAIFGTFVLRKKAPR